MSWISDIAGKAEDLLNKIDHGAATVLSHDKNKRNKNTGIVSKNGFSPKINKEKKYTPPIVAPLPSVNLSEDKTLSIQEEKGFGYVNGTEANLDSFKHHSEINDKLPLLPSEDLKIKVEDTIETSIHMSVENENSYLRNEVRSLTSEVGLLMSRIKASEREVALAQSLLKTRDSDVIVLGKEVSTLKQRLMDIERENTDLYNENLRLKNLCEKTENEEKMNYESECKFSQYQLESERKEEAFKADIASLRIRISELEESLFREKVETAKEISEANNRLAEARKELKDYRIKAQYTLAEKDKLINELRKAGTDFESTDVSSLELQQLREEHDKMIAECDQLSLKLETSRKQEVDLEKKLESMREESAATLRSTQARLADETARRLAAEEHSTSHAKEVHSVREELLKQVTSLNSKLKERERELTRLRRQLSERVMIRPEQELTAALVQKQESIEHLTIEINQLRLQLERVKMAYHEDMARTNQHLNDTDDAKARLPSLKIGFNQLDRGLRTVYSCVDRIHRATFFRRHPLSHVVIFSYLILLHLGICLVLFSYTPENHQKNTFGE